MDFVERNEARETAIAARWQELAQALEQAVNEFNHKRPQYKWTPGNEGSRFEVRASLFDFAPPSNKWYLLKFEFRLNPDRLSGRVKVEAEARNAISKEIESSEVLDIYEIVDDDERPLRRESDHRPLDTQQIVDEILWPFLDKGRAIAFP